MSSTETAVAVLVADASAPSLARRLVQAALVDSDPDLIGAAELVVSELVTNAVVHGGRHPVRVVVRGRRAGTVRLEVEQEGAPFDPAALPGTGADGGYGLTIVSALSDRWGVEEGPPTLVWCELA